jgi:hypothetical protein
MMTSINLAVEMNNIWGGRVVSSQFYHRTGSGNNIARPPEISSHFESMNFIIAHPPKISSHFEKMNFIIAPPAEIF